MSRKVEESRDGVQVVARVARILRALEPNGLSLGKLAAATDLPRSTVQRLVDALASESLVETGETGVRPGWGLQEIARQARSDVAAIVRPALELLFEETRETVDISTSLGKEVAFLDRIISDREVRVVPITDRPRPLHTMANGKAILAGLNDTAIEKLIGPRPLLLTGKSLTRLDDILVDVAEVRRTGFSYDREEHSDGICAIGIPITIEDGKPHAMSVVMPAYRFEASLSEVKQALSKAGDLAKVLLQQKAQPKSEQPV